MCINISFVEQYPNIINIISDFVGNNIINDTNNQKILDLYPNIYKNIELKKYIIIKLLKPNILILIVSKFFSKI
jgi:hypothetical protein